MIFKSRRAVNRTIPLLLLALGAAAGLSLAAFGLLEPKPFLDSHAAAQVNRTVIKQDTYQRLLSALAADKRSELTDADRIKVLNRLVDEELLVQRGVELGFLQLNSSVRNSMIQAVTTSVITGNELHFPTEQELQLFFQQNSDLFTQPPRLQLQQIHFSGSDRMAHDRADKALKMLNEGAAFEEVNKTLGDPVDFEIPDLLLPVRKLREYVGPALLETALSMKPGDFSAPIPVQGDLTIIRLTDRIAATVPALSGIRRQVETEYQRKAAEKSFHDYLKWLRSRADISIREENN